MYLRHFISIQEIVTVLSFWITLNCYSLCRLTWTFAHNNTTNPLYLYTFSFNIQMELEIDANEQNRDVQFQRQWFFFLQFLTIQLDL